MKKKYLQVKSFFFVQNVKSQLIKVFFVIFSDIVQLSEEQTLQIQQAVHILKINQGKGKYWKKVFGKRTGILILKFLFFLL